MAAGTSDFPTSLDTTTNLPAASTLATAELDGDGNANVQHSNLHGVADTALVQIETKLGTGSGAPTAAGKLLRATSASASGWSTLTFPDTAAISTIIYASAADTLAALATANNGVLVTSGTGVPSISSTLPAVTVNGVLTLAGNVTRAADQTIDLTGAATRTLTLQNSTASQVANLDIDGNYIWRNGHATGTFTFAGTPTAARTITWQDASYTVIGRDTTDTLTNKTLTTPTIAQINSGAQITLNPTTDVVVSDATGLIVGNNAQVTAGGTTQEVQMLGTSSADSEALFGRWSADGGAARLAGVKSRNATIGSFTIVQSGDEVFDLIGYADDGTDYASHAARIIFAIDGTPGVDDVPGRIVFATTADGSASATERGRITSTGTWYINDGTTVALDADATAAVGTGPGLVILRNNANAAGLVTVAVGANAVASDWYGLKTRSTAMDANTIVVSGDALVRMRGYGADGAAYREAGNISIEVDGTPGLIDMPGRIVFNVSPDGSAAPAESFRISNDANIYVANNNGMVIGNAAQITVNAEVPEFQVNGTSAADSRPLISRWSVDAGAPGIYFGKSRSATIGTFSIITSGDYLAAIEGFGDDGVDFNSNSNPSAAIYFRSSGTIAADRVPGTIEFYTATDAAPSVSTLRWSINNAGALLPGAGTQVIAATGTRVSQSYHTNITSTNAVTVDSSIVSKMPDSIQQFINGLALIDEIKVISFAHRPELDASGRIKVGVLAESIHDPRLLQKIASPWGGEYDGVDVMGLTALNTLGIQELHRENTLLRQRIAALEGAR